MKTLRATSLAVAGLLSFSNILYAQDPASAPRPAKVYTVEASETVLRRTYSAVVFPSQEVELSFRVSGRVIELPVRGADQVKKGDVIAKLDPRDFEAAIAGLESQRDQAQAQLKALESGARDEEIGALEAAVASAQAQVDQAREQADRTKQLADRGVAAQARLDQDLASLRVAEANLKAQQEQLLIGQSGGRTEDVEAAKAALRGLETQLDTARDNLDDATLTAPFDGVIARRDIENFTNVRAGDKVALLQTLSVIDLAFDVPGVDVTALSRFGTPTTVVRFDALPDTDIPAEFVEFSTQADAATQTYRARVAVTVPENLTILPGMVGQIEASIETDNRSVLTVPLTAIAADTSGNPIVWVVDPDAKTVSTMAVTLGDAAGASIEVLSGLKDGDMVVIAGTNKLQEGMAIRPITKVGG